MEFSYNKTFLSLSPSPYRLLSLTRFSHSDVKKLQVEKRVHMLIA